MIQQAKRVSFSVENEINSIKGIGVLICVDILHLIYHLLTHLANCIQSRLYFIIYFD